MHSLSRIFIFALLLLGSATARAQEARMLAPDTLSTNDVFGFTLTPDGKSGFYVKSFGGRDTLILMMAQFRGGRWEKPVTAPFSSADGRFKDIDPFVTPDGKLVLFNSTRPLPGKTASGDFNIWAARRTARGWSEPFVLSAVLNSDSSDIYATATRSGTVYFASDRAGGLGGLDLYRSEFRNGAYQPPVNLGPNINSSSGDSNPYIAPDESYLIFVSRRPDGPGGFLISFRQGSEWTKPVGIPLPQEAASGGFCPFVTADGRTFYYSRTRREGSRFIENIYFIPAEHLHLDALRDKAMQGR
ncbi:TolB family protein [Larkinella soli]|uniref:TolB family protein n=1 Tax=Larkinella soli TaxID=1770527 RepID=UPI000FFBDE71|nr:PD40 domain-containing protein [Larkinella soli]